MPPFSLMSGGSGPRRVRSGSACRHALSIIRGSHGRPTASGRATLDDADALVHHRIAHVQRHGHVRSTRAALDRAFRDWLAEMMPAGTYRGWVVETDGRRDRRRRRHHDHPLAARPALPRRSPGVRLQRLHRAGPSRPRPRAPHHGGHPRLVPRRRHHARSRSTPAEIGQPLYESMGYSVTPSPMMFLALE